MAKADRHHMGPGSQGKGSGTGAMTELPEGLLEENMVLSNRDKSRHSDQRGLDGKHVQTEQYQDHAGNRRDFDESGAPRAGTATGGDNTSGAQAPMTTTSGDDSSLASQHRR